MDKHTGGRGARLSAEGARGAGIVAIITAVFSTIWGLTGAAAAAGFGTIVGIVVLLVGVAQLVCAARFIRRAGRLPADAEGGKDPFRTRAYQLAVVGEVVGIVAAINILRRVGHPDAIGPTVAAIVGLHFFALIPAFRSAVFAAIGVGMIAVAGIALLLPTGTATGALNPRGAFLGLGCALVLWLGILPLLLRTWRATTA